MRVSAERFRARCLELVDRVSRTREPIVITRRGRPVAKLVPADGPPKHAPLFGYMAMAGSVKIRGDIVDTSDLHVDPPERVPGKA